MGLYRPTVTRRARDGTRRKAKSRLWWGSFRDPVTDELKRVGLKTADRQAAAKILAEHERRAAAEYDGTANRHEKHLRRALAEHVADFHRALLAKGVTTRQAQQVTGRARRVIEGCRFELWRDIAPSRVLQYLDGLRQADAARGTAKRGYGPRTRGFYLKAFRQFCRWLVTDGRAPTNPVEHLKAENPQTDLRRERRALSAHEARRLLHATRNGPDRDGMSGAERATLYQTALETGLRRGELMMLTWGAVDLDGTPPTVTVRAAYSKHRREDVLPLRASTAAMLARWRAQRDGDGVVGGGRVFPRLGRWVNMGLVLRADLRCARARWIRETRDRAERRKRNATDTLKDWDSDGRVVDFHALRHSFITGLARAGVHPKLAMDLARHSDINLTLARYSHTLVSEQSVALEALPDLDTTDDEARDVA